MQNRIDITNNLPSKAQAHLARKYNISRASVFNILNGKLKKRTEIMNAVIDDAQIMAAVNIWNQRFNKVAPNINPLTLV